MTDKLIFQNLVKELLAQGQDPQTVFEDSVDQCDVSWTDKSALDLAEHWFYEIYKQ